MKLRSLNEYGPIGLAILIGAAFIYFIGFLIYDSLHAVYSPTYKTQVVNKEYVPAHTIHYTTYDKDSRGNYHIHFHTRYIPDRYTIYLSVIDPAISDGNFSFETNAWGYNGYSIAQVMWSHRKIGKYWNYGWELTGEPTPEKENN